MTTNPDPVSAADRYKAAMHAVQSGVALEQRSGSDDGSPKHLRVGINSAHVSIHALSSLLIEKGILTLDELRDALADAAEAEVTRYKQRLWERFGTEVDLA